MPDDIQEIWVDVACEHCIYQITAGLMGCELGVVVAEFPDPESAYTFAVDFRIGKAVALMHGSEWEASVLEMHKWRKFPTPTLQNLLSRGRVKVDY